MAIANPEKTARMRLAVAEVLDGTMSNREDRYDLHARSVANAVCKARRERHQPGIHPALLMMCGAA